jgi:hypothetical protein
MKGRDFDRSSAFNDVATRPEGAKEEVKAEADPRNRAESAATFMVNRVKVLRQEQIGFAIIASIPQTKRLVWTSCDVKQPPRSIWFNVQVRLSFERPAFLALGSELSVDAMHSSDLKLWSKSISLARHLNHARVHWTDETELKQPTMRQTINAKGCVR